MARQPRLYLEGCAHHIIQRGNNREPCFGGVRDYKAYLAFLKESALKYQVDIHAFVLMTNHVHLLATPMDSKGISRMMQAQGRKYVRYFNYTHGRTGTLWEGRYKSTLVDSESYLITVYRYIELNPVRACMVDHPSAYPWSSYHYNALGKNIQLVTPHQLYQQLGGTGEQRRMQYRSLFNGSMLESDLAEIRDATNKAWVLGSQQFKAEVEAKTGRSATPARRGGDRKSERFREKGGIQRL